MGVCDELLVCPQVEEAAGGIVGAGADGFAIREELGREGTHHLLIRFSSDPDGIPQLVNPLLATRKPWRQQNLVGPDIGS